jgi:hypothetical protein
MNWKWVRHNVKLAFNCLENMIKVLVTACSCTRDEILLCMLTLCSTWGIVPGRLDPCIKALELCT